MKPGGGTIRGAPETSLGMAVARPNGSFEKSVRVPDDAVPDAEYCVYAVGIKGPGSPSTFRHFAVFYVVRPNQPRKSFSDPKQCAESS
jgi:hypothetical protein